MLCQRCQTNLATVRYAEVVDGPHGGPLEEIDVEIEVDIEAEPDDDIEVD